MSARKIMLLGEIGVGKSSIARRLVFDRHEASYSPTIGVDVFRYEVPATSAHPAQTLIVWDTDGNFGEAIFNHIYMRQASAAIVIADLSRPETIDTMRTLTEMFLDRLPGRYCGLVLNKVDLVAGGSAAAVPGGSAAVVPGGSAAVVPGGSAALLPEALARHRLPVTCTSAATGHNVRQVFHEAAAAIYRRAQ